MKIDSSVIIEKIHSNKYKYLIFSHVLYLSRENDHESKRGTTSQQTTKVRIEEKQQSENRGE